MPKDTKRKSELRRLSVEVTADFRRRLRMEAIRRGVPLRTLVVEALAAHVFRRQPQQHAEAVTRIILDEVLTTLGDAEVHDAD